MVAAYGTMAIGGWVANMDTACLLLRRTLAFRNLGRAGHNLNLHSLFLEAASTGILIDLVDSHANRSLKVKFIDTPKIPNRFVQFPILRLSQINHLDPELLAAFNANGSVVR